MYRILSKTWGFLGLGLIVAVWPSLAHGADPTLNPTVSLDGCDCQRAPSGLCRRWLRNDLSWQLFSPEPASDGLDNDALERAILESFASWQAVNCQVCTTTGTLPPLPADVTDASAARPNGDTGCIAIPCDSNPLGLQFDYGGINPTPLLASDCWSATGPCDGSEENTSQIAFLRTDARWPMSKLTVTTTFLTTAQDGHIVDADILLRDTTHVFCYSKCDVAQWDVRAALVLELGDAIGLGSQATQATGPIKPTDALPTYVAPDLATCGCLAYRYATNLDQCVAPAASNGCDAGPQKPLPPAPARWPWPLGATVLAACLLIVRRRQRKGVSSSAPHRRA